MFNLFTNFNRSYSSSSEYVSAAHPDRSADSLAAKIISDIQKKDGYDSHAAIEVFLTHDSIIFSGEAKTTLDINLKYLKSVVRDVYRASGYIPEMRKFWSKQQVCLPSNLRIFNMISAQSPDIAMATTDKKDQSGWNDQGVFFSSADNSNGLMLGYPHYIAKLISDYLWNLSRESILNNHEFVLGNDNKVVVTCNVKEDGFTPKEITGIIIAVPHTDYVDVDEFKDYIKFSVYDYLKKNINVPFADKCKWVINGTGRFTIFGQISDTSMCGRKLSVNSPSAGPLWCNKMIGGGSLVKPMHASDLILNLLSRYISIQVVAAGLSSFAVTGCACGIGQDNLQSLFIYGDERFNKKYAKKVEAFFKAGIPAGPIPLAEFLGFGKDGFSYDDVVLKNFFGDPNSQPWEHPDPAIILKLKNL